MGISVQLIIQRGNMSWQLFVLAEEGIDFIIVLEWNLHEGIKSGLAVQSMKYSDGLTDLLTVL